MRSRLALVVVVALALVASIAPAVSRAANPHFPAQIDLPDHWRPEGITAGRGTTVYVGSLATGSIRQVDVRTSAQSTIVTGPGLPAAGVEFDRRSNRLWVAGADSGEVRVYDAATGVHLRTYSFPLTVFLNDLVVTREAVYVTDSGRQELKVIPLGPGGELPPTTSAFTLPLTGDIAFVANQFNSNGIVARGGWLILVQSNKGKLFRVDPTTGVTREIDLHGETVTMGDGLELNGGTLYVVRNFANEIAVVRLARNLTSGQVVRHITSTSPPLDIPTTVALQAGRLWAVNARFRPAPAVETEFWITRLPR